MTGTASAPIVNVSAATTGTNGVVTLAASGAATAGAVVQATDSRLSDSRTPSGGASGDLSGTYPAPTVSKISGTALSISSLTSGDHLKYNGTNWVNAALSSADLSNDSNLLKASNMPANCAAGSSLTFSSPTGTWVCSTIPDATASSKGIMQVGTGLAVSSGTVSLTSGVIGTPGTYPKVTVDTYGRVTAGAALAAGDITSALTYTPLNKSGDVMTGAFGLNSINTAAETTLVGSFTAADKGKMWFNSDLKKIHMWDGTAVESIASPPTPTVAQDGQSLKWNNTTKSWDYFTAGAAGAGIGTFNTLTANTQTLAIGTSGLLPNWNSATSTHTLNIPMASTASVTAGLISKTDYDNFNNKLGTSSSFTGDVSGTSSTTSVDKIKGKALSYGTFAAGQVLKYDGTNWTNAALASSDLSNDSSLLKASNMPASCAAGSSLTFTSPTGTWSCTAIPDATASSKGIVQIGAGLSVASGTVSLTSGIVSAGTYPKVTVDTYGRVTAGSALASGDVTTALGFTPLNKAGDVMTGNLGLNSITTAAETTMIGSLTASDKGKMWFNSDLKKIHMWDGAAVESVSSPPTPTVAQDGQSLKWNNTTKSWDYFTAGAAGTGVGTLNGLTANTQSFAVGTSGTAPAFNSATSTHTLNIPMASVASVTAGLISKTDYDTFNNKVGTSYSLAGDVTGTPASTSVDKIKGKAVTTPTTAGQMLVYDGTGITPVVMSGDATMAAGGALSLKNTGTAGTYYKVTTDAQGRVTSGTASLAAADIPALDAAKITTGTVADARLPASATYWQAATGGINFAGGNVGVGTTSPSQKLSVAGTIESTSGGIKFPDGTVQVTSATGGTNGSMVTNWPDNIRCVRTADSAPIIYSLAYISGGARYSIADLSSGVSYNYTLNFNMDGTFANKQGLTDATNCDTKTITQLYTSGQAYNLVKGPAGQWLEASGNAYRNTGNVGIGTTTPLAPLSIVAAQGTVALFQAPNAGLKITADDATLSYTGSADTVTLSATRFNGGNMPKLRLAGQNGLEFAADANTVRMTVAAAGNVGIGTTAPAEKLDVAGKVKATTFESTQAAQVKVMLNACGGACGSYHTLNTWMNVGVNYTHSVYNNDTSTFTTNTTGSMTVNKTGTYLVRVIMMQVPTAASGAVYACPFLNGTVNCPGSAGNQVQEGYATAGWWRSSHHDFTMTISAGTVLSYGYYPIEALNYWANDGWTAMEVTRLN